MKKIALTLIALCLFVLQIFAQAPQSFKYQSVVRDANGDAMQNQTVDFKISILQTTSSGTPVYVETFSTTTNNFGLINLEIGTGTVMSGNFSSINWGTDKYFLQVELDPDGNGYQLMGVSQLLSVPYALNAGNVDYNDTSATNEIQAISFSGDTLYLSNGNSVYLGNYSNIWQQNGNDIYYNNGYVGVGLTDPHGKLIIKGDASIPADSAIFEVRNKDGQVVFAVYQEGVRVYVDDTGTKAISSKGGFAVGGFNATKSLTNEYLRVTPDSVRVYIEEGSGSKSISSKGGFAVGGFNATKVTPTDYFNISGSDSVGTINPSEARILWYPLKEAFLSGRVLIEAADSIGLNSWATGYESKAIGDFSQAMGYKVKAKGKNSTAIGYKSKAIGVNSYAFGANVIALDTGAYAFGKESVAASKSSFVFGANDTATAISAMALGYRNKASGVASLALGAYTQATDTLSVAMGYNTISSGVSSVAMGDGTRASGVSALALGSQTIASGETSTAMGNGTIASGTSSIAMGHLSIATGYHAIAMGDSTQATNDDATSMGYKTKAEGFFSTAMGDSTIAHGDASIAMGYGSVANGYASLVSGNECTANGDASIAMGFNTDANGYASLSIGNATNASGDASVALGINTFAEGNGSVAFGASTHSTSMGSFVIGSFNETFSSVNSTSITSDLFVIGNGTDASHTHNAFTVLKSGFVGINTNTQDVLIPSIIFAVDGDARITGNIYYGAIGTSNTYNKPDFVFNPDYNKDFNISYIEKFIQKNNHLPWLTAAKDEKGGINMTRMSFETLEAVENQQLQIIDLNKKLNEYQKIILKQQKLIEQQQKDINKIKKQIKKIK